MAGHSNSMPTRIPFRTLPASGALTAGIAVALLIGVAAAVLTLMGGEHGAERFAQAFHFNWIFWSGLSMGMVMFTVALHLTNARWSWSLRRFALAGVAFLPVSALLFIVDWFGADHLYHHWLHPAPGDHVLEAKSGFLNLPFMIVRDFLAVGILYGLAIYFAMLALRPDVYGAAQTDGQRGWYERLTRNFRGVNEEAVRSHGRMTVVAVLLAFAYAFLWGLLGVDLGMSMLPHWFSTMFPVIFFIDGFHAGLAMTALMLVVFRKRIGVEEFITRNQFHDLGKLIFAFAVFWMYINWSQYVVIWYGGLPHEQEWFVLRFHEPFGTIVRIAVGCIFVAPFLGLLTRPPKKNPVVLAAFAVVILVGHWLERFLLTVPSLYHSGEVEHLPLGLPEIGLALGFGALWLFCYTWFMRTFPVLPSPATLAAVDTGFMEIPHEGAAHA
ncbi:MAG TPA: hypothetical protein VF613_14155 [Longimicrobium sp.]|jgi:hypothetical protein